MSSDKVLQRSSVEQVPHQGSSVSSDRVLLQPLQLNGTKSSLEKFSSEEFLRTIETVSSIDSTALNRNGSDPLHVGNENLDISLDRLVTSRNLQNVPSTCAHTSGYVPHHSSPSKQQEEAGSSTSVPLQKHFTELENSSSETELKVHFTSSITELKPGKDIDRKVTHHSLANNNLNFPSENSSSNVHTNMQPNYMKRAAVIGSEVKERLRNVSPMESDSDVACDLAELSEKDSNKLDQLSGSADSENEENVISLDQDDNSITSLSESDLLDYKKTDPAISGWKLDRRDSGHLYCRRDSSSLNGVDPRSRVKFRFDVEVCEFESRFSGAEDLQEEDDDNDSAISESEEETQDKATVSNVESSEQLSSGTTTVVGAVAILAAVMAVLYMWISSFTDMDEET